MLHLVHWLIPHTAAASDAAAAGHELTAMKAALLGLVEGITEYLPISSTGHLILTERLLDVGQHHATKDAADTYTITIQAGAILAVLVLFWSRIVEMGRGLAGRDEGGRHLLVATIVAFIPAAIVGVGLEKPIKNRLFGTWPVIVAWIVGGIIVLLIARPLFERAQHGVPLEALTVRGAVIIGVAQCFALWPGTSRSLVTIVAALAVGLTMSARGRVQLSARPVDARRRDRVRRTEARPGDARHIRTTQPADRVRGCVLRRPARGQVVGVVPPAARHCDLRLVPNRNCCARNRVARDGSDLMPISTVIFDFGGVISSPLFVGIGAFEEAEGYPKGSLLRLMFGETHYIGVEGRAVAEALARRSRRRGGRGRGRGRARLAPAREGPDRHRDLLRPRRREGADGARAPDRHGGVRPVLAHDARPACTGWSCTRSAS